jgi:hypothetical protein
MPQNDTQTPANAPATVLPTPDLSGSKLDEYAGNLLTKQLAQLKAGSTVASDFRWYPAGKPPHQKIVIMPRKGERKALATITRTGKLSALYPSWEPAITEWNKRHATVKRQKLADLPVGSTPKGKIK